MAFPNTFADWGWSPAVNAMLAFAAMLALTPLVIRLARRMDWLAHPVANRWHKKATAQMGGVAIYAAAAAAVGGSAVLSGGGAAWNTMWPVYGGATLMFATGLLDDRYGIEPSAKVMAQVAATTLLLYAGYGFGQGGPYWLVIPLTFLWVIGVTNAVNLIDGMDGLAAGLSAIAAVMMAMFAALAGEVTGIGAMLAVAGAAGGFLIYNFKPARIFMGDCGSLFLGYAIAAFAVVIQGQISGRSGLAVYLTSVAVLAVPIFDTTLVTVVRLMNGRGVTQSGNDHTMHRLAMLGMSERKTVLVLYGIGALFGGMALVFYSAAVKLLIAVAVFLAVGLAVFGIHIGGVEVYDEEEGAASSSDEGAGGALPQQEWTLARQLGETMRAFFGSGWKAVVGVAGDLLVVAAAFTLAHYLRYEDGLAAAREMALMQMLPAVVVGKLFVFSLGGLYRGLWRRAGTPELVRIVGTSTLASGCAYLLLTPFYGVGYLSEAVFFIDWMIVTLAVMGTRFGFRGLRQYLSTQGDDGRRVVLYGAGDAGALTLRRLRQDTETKFHPVGFIDDDPAKRGLTAQGLFVLGGFEDLSQVCREHHVEEVLITAFGMSNARKQEVQNACREISVACRVFDVSLRSFEEERQVLPEDREPVVVSGDGR
jgi:UDP-GlcNAc:undecaprenyl-phosphate GlcNAc-1-phosphate transferase